jgi:hypothetical protein
MPAIAIIINKIAGIASFCIIPSPEYYICLSPEGGESAWTIFKQEKRPVFKLALAATGWPSAEI